MKNKEFFSAAFQITQECINNCNICHRRYIRGEKNLDLEDMKNMAMILKKRGLRRLTITGGEPMLLENDLFDFIRFLHKNEIHTCLSTSGYNLNGKLLDELDNYVDQLLLPIRSLTLTDWAEHFGNTKYVEGTFKNVINILQWSKTRDIILMISTVMHRGNIHKIVDLGWKLFSLNPNIIWSIDDYYAMGLKKKYRDQFELTDIEIATVRQEISKTFGNFFKHVVFNDAKSRRNAPDFFITQNADLVTTSDNEYSTLNPKHNILTGDIPLKFLNRRNWSHYRILCRDWGWGDL